MVSFRFGNFLNDLFAVITVSFGLVSWIVALGGAAASNQLSFPRFTWWGIVYQMLVILIVFALYLNNNIELYKFSLVGLTSVAFIYSTNSTNSLIYNTSLPSNLACAAGCILLSILNIIWILYFGGHPELPTNQFVDSFAIRLRVPHADSSAKTSLPEEKFPAFQDESILASRNIDSLPQKSSLRNAPYMSSSHLNGLENLSSSDLQNMQQYHRESRDFTREDIQVIPKMTSQHQTTFKYRARALYHYDANPDDHNEISFEKNEILEVEDISGKWWQARRANGEVGICPSNYVTLLE